MFGMGSLFFGLGPYFRDRVPIEIQGPYLVPNRLEFESLFLCSQTPFSFGVIVVDN